MAEVKIPTGSIPPTSSPKKQREKAAPKVSRDDIVSTKKSFGQKFKEAFLSVDGKDFKDYLIMDVIVPGIQHTILDTLSMSFFHQHIDNSYGRGGNYYYRNRDRGTAYDAMYGGRKYNTDRSRREQYRRDDKIDYRNIVLRSRAAADDVVDDMNDRIYRNGQVTVAELLDLINLPSEAVDNNWGWTDERDIGIKNVSSGWLIDVRDARFLG